MERNPQGFRAIDAGSLTMGHRSGDQRFKETMQDFVKIYAGKAATTEDFKAAVEKPMTVEMDLRETTE